MPHTVTSPASVWTVDIRQAASMLSCSAFRFWPYRPDVAVKIKIHQTGQHFSNRLLFHLEETFQILADRRGSSTVFCCCSPSALVWHLVCSEMLFFTFLLGCNKCLFELLLSSLSAWSNMAIVASPASVRYSRPLTGDTLFLRPFSLNPRDDCVGNPKRLVHSEILRLAYLKPINMADSKWLKSPFFSNLLLSYTFSRLTWDVYTPKCIELLCDLLISCLGFKNSWKVVL